MILIDLQQAFDTKDHEILLQKLKAIKFSESSIGLHHVSLKGYSLKILKTNFSTLERFLAG